MSTAKVIDSLLQVGFEGLLHGYRSIYVGPIACPSP